MYMTIHIHKHDWLTCPAKNAWRLSYVQ